MWPFSSCSARASHCSGFSFCGAKTLQLRLSGCGMGLVAPRHVGHWARDRTHIHCIAKQILIPWTIWEIPSFSFLTNVLRSIGCDEPCSLVRGGTLSSPGTPSPAPGAPAQRHPELCLAPAASPSSRPHPHQPLVLPQEPQTFLTSCLALFLCSQ